MSTLNTTPDPFVLEGFRRRVQRLRKQRGLTTHEVGERIGVTASLVRHWESGIRCPDLQQIYRLARALDYLPEVLIADLHGELGV